MSIERYEICGKQLSKLSGVRENHISKFRRDKTNTLSYKLTHSLGPGV